MKWPTATGLSAKKNNPTRKEGLELKDKEKFQQMSDNQQKSNIPTLIYCVAIGILSAVVGYLL